MNHDNGNRQDDVREVEQSLRGLAPANTGMNRDRLMYEAGRAACEAAAEPRGDGYAAGGDDSKWTARFESVVLARDECGALVGFGDVGGGTDHARAGKTDCICVCFAASDGHERTNEGGRGAKCGGQRTENAERMAVAGPMAAVRACRHLGRTRIISRCGRGCWRLAWMFCRAQPCCAERAIRERTRRVMARCGGAFGRLGRLVSEFRPRSNDSKQNANCTFQKTLWRLHPSHRFRRHNGR